MHTHLTYHISRHPTFKHSIQIVNYSTSYCNIHNIELKQFAYSNGTEGITQSLPIQTSVGTKMNYNVFYCI